MAVISDHRDLSDDVSIIFSLYPLLYINFELWQNVLHASLLPIVLNNSENFHFLCVFHPILQYDHSPLQRRNTVYLGP